MPPVKLQFRRSIRLLQVRDGVIDLLSGKVRKELNESGRKEFSRFEGQVCLIVLAGEVDCGETTLLSCLYELF